MDKAPDAFRTISEVAQELDIPQNVLRFWETRFSQIKPMKRSGGRRYYRPDDVDLLKGIRRLLYGEGYTIKGLQRILKEQGPRHVQAIGKRIPFGADGIILRQRVHDFARGVNDKGCFDDRHMPCIVPQMQGLLFNSRACRNAQAPGRASSHARRPCRPACRASPVSSDRRRSRKIPGKRESGKGSSRGNG